MGNLFNFVVLIFVFIGDMVEWYLGSDDYFIICYVCYVIIIIWGVYLGLKWLKFYRWF